jgi:pyruvate/2-oxoglutarate dehydrogenase complex dihydrolipoamide dehydrogenase (E3) component
VAGAGDALVFRRGHARFAGAKEVDVAGERWRADVVVINVGARPAVPPIDGLASVPWLENRRAMALDALPEHLVVLGGGYVGCELAQMFRRFGSEVTIVDRGERLLAREDADVSDELGRVFGDEGIALRLAARVRSVGPRAGGGVEVTLAEGEPVRGSHLLVATGRAPNTGDLGCDAGGVALDDKGFVVAGDRYETSAPGVFAVGDAIAQPQFTHVAWDDHRILFEHLMGRPSRTRTGRFVPSGVFTDPQVARVGLTEHEAKARGVAYELATMPFGDIARAKEVGETAGVMKLLLDPKTEHILGAALVGAEAAELIHVFVVLMQAGATARALVDAEAIHPTFAEGLQSLVMTLPRYALR